TDGDGSHGSTSKTPSYTKSVSWHHYRRQNQNHHASTQAVVGHAVPLWENIDIIVLCSVAAPRGAAALNELVLFD
ncbi:hypothetical protein ACRFE4_24670, partial [Klebsiella pneumoniae]